MSRKSLAERVVRWNQIMRQEATGPLLIAPEVVEVIDSWDSLSAQAGGVSVGAWLKGVFGHSGRNTKYWRDRFDAVASLDVRNDRSVARTMHHLAAVWLAGMPADGSRKKVLQEVYVLCRSQKHEPVTLHQVKRVYYEIVGKPARAPKKECGECARLRALLKKHGISVEEASDAAEVRYMQ